MHSGFPENKNDSINIFLLKACEEAYGDIQRVIDPHEIVKRVGYVSINETNVSDLLNKLKDLQFIEINDSGFTVTYYGIYYVARIMGRSPESLGILSEEDMRTMINRFNNWVYNVAVKTGNKISFDMIANEFSSVIGEIPIRQLINTLLKRGVLIDKGTHYELNEQNAGQFYI